MVGKRGQDAGDEDCFLSCKEGKIALKSAAFVEKVLNENGL